MNACKIHNISDSSLWRSPPINDPTDLIIAVALHRKHVKGKTANITSISALTGISRSTVARRASNFEKHDFVELRISGKSSIIVLTSKGVDVIGELITRLQCAVSM
ncbi:MAG: hypothetical protein ACM31L_20170 [Actinomycetota bacterium]